MKRLLLLGPLILLLLATAGCSESTSPGQATDQYFESGADFAGSHILIAYQGSERAKPEISRTKEEARQKAMELIARLQKDPSQFHELAQQESDGPSAPQGGRLGAWKKGRMVPEFDAAIEKLEIGQVTPEPVETAFGYHIILREDTRQRLWGAWGLVLAWDGAARVTPKKSRTKDEAQQLAQELQSRVTAGNFDELCGEYSDAGPHPTFIGPIPEEAASNPVTAQLLGMIQGLAFDAVGGPVETPSGFVFLKRIKLEQRAGSHILVAYQGAQGANPSITRSKEEARQKARDLIQRLQQDPSLFPHLAREESDGPSARNGGSLGTWFKGRMTPEFDAAIDHLAVGEISSTPVETPFGFHILQRREVGDVGKDVE